MVMMEVEHSVKDESGRKPKCSFQYSLQSWCHVTLVPCCKASQKPEQFLLAGLADDKGYRLLFPVFRLRQETSVEILNRYKLTLGLIQP
jgi:hypothetical protein